jgi:N-hydroxyarylamine O-acetyltransferase
MPSKLPNLSTYLNRIGFHDTPKPNLPTLRALQHAHIHAVPFENLDVQLGRPVGFDIDALFDKIVNQRRGGWCYELNGLFGWALQAIGFSVERISAGVMREQFGDARLGNHLCLLVYIDQPYLVDVGFGGSLLWPLPLQQSEHDHSPYRITLTKIDAEFWRFSERTIGEPFSFDFRATKADEQLLATQCTALQSSLESMFVQNLTVQRRSGDGHLALRGRVLTTAQDQNKEKKVLGSAQELVTTLRDVFQLDLPEAAGLWPKICARHDAVFESSQTPYPG